MGFKICDGTQGLRNRDAQALDACASGGEMIAGTMRGEKMEEVVVE